MSHDERASREEARPLPEVDVLIERLIDGEAGSEERARFRRLAEADRDLWQRLAERQQERLDLTGAFEAEVTAADRIELPELEPDQQLGRPVDRLGNAPGLGTGRWTGRFGDRFIIGGAAIGWAAALVMAALWLVPAPPSREAPQEGQAVRTWTTSPAERTPDEHLAAYLTAPNVLGELEPVVLEVEELGDGRTAIRYLRRIEEFAFVPSEDPLPLTERGRLTVDPADLRDTVPPRRNAD